MLLYAIKNTTFISQVWLYYKYNKNNQMEADMDQKSRDYFKEKLKKEEEEILSSLNQLLNTEYGPIDLYSTELSLIDNHPGDIATEVFLMEQGQGFENQFKNILDEIEDSLLDIKIGKYGFCKLCGKRIGKKRLDLIPYIKTCLNCSERENKEDLINYEQLEKDQKFILFNLDSNDDLMYDREDVYQDVAEFNITAKDDSYSTGDDLGIMDEDKHGLVEDIERISQEDYDKTLD